MFAAANHVASFCKQVDIITCLGDIDSHEDLDPPKPCSRMSAFKTFMRPGAPTTLKRRFVDPSYMRKLFEVYFMNDEPLTPDVQRRLDRADREMAPELRCGDRDRLWSRSDRVVVDRRVDVEFAKFLAVNTQSNSANMGYNLVTKYPRADYVCIDAPEARLAVSDRISKVGDIARRMVERSRRLLEDDHHAGQAWLR